MELVPHISLEGIELESTKQMVRQQANAAFRDCRDILGNLHDHFESLGVKVYYDDQDKCIAIEAFAPAQPTFHGTSIIGQRYSEVQSWLAEQDPAIEFDSGGVKCPTLGIALWIPDFKSGTSSRIETLLLHRHDYESEDQELLQKKLLKAYGLADMSEYTFWERMKIRFRKLLN